MKKQQQAPLDPYVAPKPQTAKKDGSKFSEFLIAEK
jgi:hypothetical protein